MDKKGLSYKDSGVDIDAANQSVDMIDRKSTRLNSSHL